MLKIVEIEIENFRSIKETRVKFSQESNILCLVGKNDQGKSNILKAIHHFFDTQFDRESGTFKLNNFDNKKDKFFFNPKKQCNIKITFSGFTDIRTSIPGLSCIPKPLETFKLGLRINQKGTCTIYPYNKHGKQNDNTNKRKEAEKFYKWLINKAKVEYLETSRNDLDAFNIIISKALNIHHEKDHNKVYKELQEDIYQKIVKTHREFIFKDIFNDLSYGKPEHELVKESELIEAIFMLGRTYLKQKNRKVSFFDVGQGVLSYTLISALKNQLNSEILNLYLLEEPCLHLHPSLQRKLIIDKLKEASIQSVISTHSSTVVDVLSLNELAYVKKENDTKIYYHNNQNRMDRDDAFIYYKNSELYFADLIILVEGWSDFVFFRYLLDREGLHNVSIISLGGNKQYGYALNFINSYKNNNINPFEFLIITDLDSIKENDKPLLAGLKEAQIIDDVEYNQLLVKLTDDEANLREKLKNDYNSFVLKGDLEYILFDANNLDLVYEKFKKIFPRYEQEKSIDSLSKFIGSKGPNADWQKNEDNKKAWVTKSLYKDLVKTSYSSNVLEILEHIESKLKKITH